ncbi:MAG TPA: glutathione S-transferase N-terminal domain-containing protein [Polyangiaceae bacterium]
MNSIELFGTVTSPYVRRVRIVLKEIGRAYRWVDTSQPEGQSLMRDLNPLWKIPTVRLDGRAIFDSGVIVRQLLKAFGHGGLALHDPDDVEVCRVVTVTDGVLDALINSFYLKKEGVSDQTPYLQKQEGRSRAALAWLESEVRGPWLTRTHRFGLPEIGLITALEWMMFRQVYPVDQHPRLVEFLKQHQARESIASTGPERE